LDLQNKLDDNCTLEITSLELKRLFSQADKNNDGFVDKEEFQ
jgi:Ca2+-binding EF-hand superfamily protein